MNRAQESRAKKPPNDEITISKGKRLRLEGFEVLKQGNIMRIYKKQNGQEEK